MLPVSEMLPFAFNAVDALAPMGSQDPKLTAEVVRLQTAPTIAVTLKAVVAVVAPAPAALEPPAWSLTARVPMGYTLLDVHRCVCCG